MLTDDVETERAVGEAIRSSGIPRSELFVTTKLSWNHHACVEKAINDSLEKSGLEYFDLVCCLLSHPVEYV